MKTKSLYLAAALGMMLGFSSCDLNYFPSDELNSNALLSSDDGPVSVINGCYAMMKEEYAYVDPYESGNTYILRITLVEVHQRSTWIYFAPSSTVAVIHRADTT